MLCTIACQPKQESAMPPTETAAPFNVMSYNIRYDNPGDSAHAWPFRKERVANLIQYH